MKKDAPDFEAAGSVLCSEIHIPCCLFFPNSVIIGTVICMNTVLLNKVKTRMRTVHLSGAEKWRVRPFNKSGRNLFFFSY